MNYVESLTNFLHHLENQKDMLLDNMGANVEYEMPVIKIEVAGHSTQIEMHADAYDRITTMIETEIKEYKEMMKHGREEA